MSKLLALAVTGLLAFAPLAVAQDVPAAEQARLEALPAVRVPLRGATLASAIRLLASDAKLSYLSPADADFGDRIGSDATVNPYRMLRLLAKDYHFDMGYEDGIWRFVRINDAELITKAYPLRFNNLTQVSISTGNLNSQLASAAGGSNGMGGGGGGGQGGAGGSGAPPSSGGLGNVPMELKVSRIVDDVKKILAIPARALAATRADPDAGSMRRAADAGKAFDPIWDPDSSSLFVVATREQHELIAEYLRTVDRPQKLIRIAVKFVETDRSPTQNLGVDWTQSILGGNVPITLSGVPAGTTGTATGSAASGGAGTEVALQRTVSLGSHLPVALLSANAMSWTMAAIASDRRSSVVQDPVIFTANNHQVQFKATTEQPIQQGSTTFGSATAATSTQIAYLEVGTQIRVLPSLLPAGGDGREIVQCNFAIDVSSIVGTQIIGGNPYPVTSDRNYSYSVPIPTGKTLVIAGLEERSRLMSDSKVPIFGDIPVLGYAFKNKSDQITHTTLLAFITPEVIDDPAMSAGAAADLPPLRHRTFQGSPTESLGDVSRSLDGLAADIAALQAAARPATKQAILNALDHIAIELSLMDVRLGELKLNGDRLVAPQSKRVDQDKELLSSAKDLVMQVSTLQGA